MSRNGREFPSDFIPSPDVFPEIPQSRKHEIRDVQWKVRRWKAVLAGKHADAGWRIKGKCSLRDYQVWLLREPYGFLDLSIEEIFEFFPFLKKQLSGTSASVALPLSFQRIGDLLFPEVDDPDNRKKRAADAHDRVESEFGRGTLKRKPKLNLKSPGHYW